nr:glycoside hydrolase family 30 beta sandwich domain-containing protein [Marinifaba aquimaris]
MGTIHTDTIQTPVTVSGECSLGEEALRYAVRVETDTEGDAHELTVYDSETDDLIAELGAELEGEFTLDCADLGTRQFYILNNSRGIQSQSIDYTHTVNSILVNTVPVWLTSYDQTALLEKQADEELKIGTGTALFQIDVSEGVEYQTIDSFGATLTDSAASLINASDKRDAIIAQLFNRDDGIGISGLRYPLAGMSEFVSRVAQSYNERPAGLTDPDLDFFTIAADRDFLLPVLQSALAENSDIDVIATNWSAPGWMKDSDSLQGGEVRNEFYTSYANYFVKFFEDYQTEGIEFDYFSVQNQPHEESDFPTQRFEALDFRDFYTDYLDPALTTANINPEFIVWDGNWTDNDTQNSADIANYAKTLFSYNEINNTVNIAGFQCYQATNGFADYSQAFDELLLNRPDKSIYLTECSNQEDSRSFGEILAQDAGDMFIGSLRKSVKAIYYSSLALDENNGPTQGGCADCRGVVTIDSNGDMLPNAEYFALAHFSQFIRPDAVRIDSTTFAGQLETVSFKNPDATVVTVVVNRTNAAISFDINWKGQFFNYNLPQYSVVNFKWDSTNAPIANEQQIIQASDIAQDTYTTIQAMRESTTGMYRSHYDLVGSQDAMLSVSATAHGLTALNIGFSMGWQPDAATLILATLESLNGDNPSYVHQRNDLGMFKAEVDTSGNNGTTNEYSVIATAQLVSALNFTRNVFASNTDIVSKVDSITGSIDWAGIIIDASAGTVAATQDLTGNAQSTQGVYNLQMQAVWHSRNTGDVSAIDLWTQHYDSGEAFERYVYDGNVMPADENGDPISATIHQQNFFMIKAALDSANYRTLMSEQAVAEKAYWQANFSEADYVWGYGFGENTFASETPYYDTLADQPGNYAHAPTIAGYIVSDLTLLEDFLEWDDNNFGIATTQISGVAIPWRYSQQTPSWTPSTIEMDGIINQLIGLTAHPGLLDLSYYRNNTEAPGS